MPKGFQVAIRIIPFMVAIFTAIGMLGQAELLSFLYWSPLTNLIGMPAEALPMALLRPVRKRCLRCNVEIVSRDPNSTAYLVSVFQGQQKPHSTFLQYILAIGSKLPSCIACSPAGLQECWIGSGMSYIL